MSDRINFESINLGEHGRESRRVIELLMAEITRIRDLATAQTEDALKKQRTKGVMVLGMILCDFSEYLSQEVRLQIQRKFRKHTLGDMPECTYTREDIEQAYRAGFNAGEIYGKYSLNPVEVDQCHDQDEATKQYMEGLGK